MLINEAQIQAALFIFSLKGQAPVVSVPVAAQCNALTALLHLDAAVWPHETDSGLALSRSILHRGRDGG